MAGIGTWLRTFGIDPKRALRAASGLPKFLSDRRSFKRASGDKWQWGMELPMLTEWGETSGALGAYFLQDLTVARWIREESPHRHVDIGSRIDGFVGNLAAFRSVEVIDIRPAPQKVQGIDFHQLDLMKELPGDWISCTDSLSCLHTIEHFGLGRYGDHVDSEGHVKGLRQLKRMVAPGGALYLSVPMGSQRVEFNAHRVFCAETLLGWFDEGWEIKRFAVVDDSNQLHLEPVREEQAITDNFGCELGVGIVMALRNS